MVKHCFGLLIALLFLFSGTSSYTPTQTRSIATTPSYTDLTDKLAVESAGKAFAIIGDTQSTGTLERVFLRRESNNIYRKVLVSEMLKAKPAFVVHLGDLTELGTSYSAWNAFDQLFSSALTDEIPLLPVYGNHEYWRFNKARSLSNMISRFPWMNVHWYSRRVGDLALIFLDTNIEQFSKSEWVSQIAWYNKKLAEIDRDKQIKGVLVFAHHPPYTNSKVTSDEEHVQKAFLPAFYYSKKSLAFIVGHAHGYEHFKKEGKDFIVSGGGGGPRVKLKVEPKARHQDLFSGPSPRPFNFLWINPTEQGLHLEVKGFQKNEDFHLIDQFDLLYYQ